MVTTNRSRVVVVGTGQVGSAVASSIVLQGLTNELVLINHNPGKARGLAMDLADGSEFLGRFVSIRHGDWDDCSQADIIIITAGPRPVEGRNRLDGLMAAVDIVTPMLDRIRESGFDGILIMVSNPVDVLSWYAWKRTGLPRAQVIGSGTALDTSRMKTIIGEVTGLDPRTVSGYVIGEHGDSQFIPWSTVSFVGKPFARFLADNPGRYPGVSLNGIENATRRRGDEIKNRRGGTSYGIASTVSGLVKTILWDERRVIPVSTLIDGEYEYGERDVFLSLPIGLDGNGANEFTDLHLTAEEMERFHHCAEVVRSHCALIADRL
ncbi:L-lactate dehydrogenase [Bifidobacterium lemurum]|uniref:L-lactate dehydrogenase n=1 Tax=Bifidobacterium lemurum TaxID=1603886 RepID=A0A261FM46_9BIFI|nr:NAD(P)-binding domain-containing protein [Bifidobacterium lemurum]OZG60260.1 L-lactate dehydrogenase [Bifidobacterium lemurum]QOL34151.1 NAD(P)-binding domain-containing protein [Bifidobacterium lemurum]